MAQFMAEILPDFVIREHFFCLKAWPNARNICNIVAWCCDNYWTRWPNARNTHHNMSLFMSPRPLALGRRPKISIEDFEWYRASGPSAHVLAQKCCVNVAKRVQHHATSKMLHEKFDRFQIWSNIIQHVATHRNISQQGGQTYATCCAQQCCKMLRWNVASVWPGLNDLPFFHLRASAPLILLAFEKFTRAYLFQIELEIMW